MEYLNAASKQPLPFDISLEKLDRPSLESLQLERFQRMSSEIIPTNPFYTRKLNGFKQVNSWADFYQLPFTTKEELMTDQHQSPPYGTNLTYPLDRYIKVHHTSGTNGKEPIRWLDTEESWQWWERGWARVLNTANVEPGDRVFFAFSYGPFVGFWSGHDATRIMGAMTISGGGQNSEQRLKTLLDNQATVLCSTPTYALHLAETAKKMGINLAKSSVTRTIHAGEPGASIPSMRDRIEKEWGAKSFDHTGMTELGPTGFSCIANSGVHLNEVDFIPEVINPITDQPVSPGEQGELIMTNLGRWGSPLIRYRTGDTVKIDNNPCACGRTFTRMVGGILGRTDDMVPIRGVNVFPSAIAGVIGLFEGVSEYNIEVRPIGQMSELTLVIESDDPKLVSTIVEAVNNQLLLRVDYRIVPPGTLPRSELKAKRLIRLPA